LSTTLKKGAIPVAMTCSSSFGSNGALQGEGRLFLVLTVEKGYNAHRFLAVGFRVWAGSVSLVGDRERRE